MSRDIHVRRRHINVVRKSPVTFAMIELSDPTDCNDRKRLWRRMGFKDITPGLAKKTKVPSLNGEKAVSIGKDLIKDMKSVNAHWYLLSGHHGRLYAKDIEGFANNHNYYNNTDYAGFFNNDYHHGRWSFAWRDAARLDEIERKLVDPVERHKHKKLVAHFDNELYLNTTSKAPKPIARFKQDNPLLDDAIKAKRSNKCLGIIISACNTLAFKEVRKFWQGYYPNSVFFGTFRTIGYGYQVTNAIARSSMTNTKFWRDPSSVLASQADCVRLAKQISMKFPRSRRDLGIGMMFKGKVYLPHYERGKVTIEVLHADDDLPYSSDPWTN